MKQTILPFLKIGLCTCAYLSTTSDITLAQVTSDNTVNTKVNQNGRVAEITGGETRGDNLFHSFREFSVRTGNEAFFNNAASISNIFSRVTGGKVSSIDGLIRANDASLFLINPKGIIFGENARLDIGGSFLGSSASSILFDGGEFSAVDLDNPPLLTVNAPIGLGFRDNPGNIENRSVGQNPNGETNVTGGAVGLQVPNGETLAIVGGNVLLDDGNLTAKGGHIEIGSVLGEGEVGISKTDIGFVFNYDSINSFGDITLQDTAVVDVTASGGGNINLNADNIVVDNSRLSAGILPGSGSVEAQAGDISLSANGSVLIDNNAITNNVGDSNSTAIGNSGNIIVTTENLTVNNSAISSSTFGLGNSGDLIINASNSVKLNGERPNTRGGTGSPGGLFAQIDRDGEGQAGDININTNLLSVSNGSKVQVATFGKGNAGNLTIRANQIEVFNDPIFSDFTTGIFASIAIDPLTENPPQGSAGNIDIETQTLKINDGGKITSSTQGIGNAGSIRIKAEDSLEISGVDPEPEDGTSLLGAEVESGATGNGGSIDVETNKLTIQDRGQVLVSSEGSGNAGNLTIKANNIELEDQGQIVAATVFGEGGNITLDIDENLTLGSNSLISAQAFNDAIGGNIDIDTDFIVAFPNQIDGNGNDIIANAVRGNGGIININAESLLGIQERQAVDNNRTNDIDASSRFRLDGTVTINTPDINPLEGTTELPTNVVEPQQTTTQACQADREATAQNSLVIKGKGGVPPTPDMPLNSENITIEGNLADADTKKSNQIATSTIKPIQLGDKEIMPARGVVKTTDGRVILTAYATNELTNRLNQGSINCNSVQSQAR